MLNFATLRDQFPGLNQRRDGLVPIFFDGPAGTQVPQRVIDAISYYLTHCNANHGGVFATSRESDRILHQAHEAVADLLNAPSPDEVIFGANMTTLTLHLSRAVSRTLRPGDEVGRDYMEANLPLAVERVAQSGVRLAATLNELLD